MFTILARRFFWRVRRRQSFSLPPLTPSDILRSIMPPTVAGSSRGRALCTSSHWRLGRTRPHRPRSPALSRVSPVGRPEVGLLPDHLPGTGPPMARSPLLPPQGQRGRGRRGPHGRHLHGGFRVGDRPKGEGARATPTESAVLFRPPYPTEGRGGLAQAAQVVPQSAFGELPGDSGCRPRLPRRSVRPGGRGGAAVTVCLVPEPVNDNGTLYGIN